MGPVTCGPEGNEVANGLAVEGMCHSPLWGAVHRRNVRVQCSRLVSEEDIVSQTGTPLDEGVEVVSVGRVDFEEDSRDGGSGSDGTISDSTDSAGPRMGMPHRDHILYADLLQGYNDSDGEVSGPSIEVSDDERYMSRKRAQRVLGSWPSPVVPTSMPWRVHTEFRECVVHGLKLPGSSGSIVFW